MHSDWRQNEWIKLIINNILQQNAIYWYGCQASIISSEAKTNSQSGMPHPFPFGNQSTHKKEYYYKERKGGERERKKVNGCLLVNWRAIRCNGVGENLVLFHFPPFVPTHVIHIHINVLLLATSICLPLETFLRD